MRLVSGRGFAWLCCASLLGSVACNEGGDLGDAGESNVTGDGGTRTDAQADGEAPEPDASDDRSPAEGLGDGELMGSGGGLNGGELATSDALGAGATASGGFLGGSTTGGSTGSTSTTGSAGSLDGTSGSGDGALEGEFGVATGSGQVQAGILTAGAWDDNLNYERFVDYREEWNQADVDGALGLALEEHDKAHGRFGGERKARQTLDISLVIDTTGSMSDEIVYLQSEFDAISRTIEEQYPKADQRWSLVVYRDETDDYVVRWFDFRDEADELRQKLAEQHAGGGGDFPEASHAALDIMTQLAWRTNDATARLAFWLADAPHHASESQTMTEALRAAAGLDIHIYPVASSGIDEHTELSMRSAAQLTGGRYLFLTDDSGVGGAHKEPSIPCYFVTKLDDAILRMVDIELSGVYREPEEAQILRTGGDPQDGACTLASGTEVQIF